MAVCTHVQSLDTEVFADTVAWNGGLLACGTYQLEEKSGVRKGGVLLYRLLDNVEEETPFLQPCLLGPSTEEGGDVNGPPPLSQRKGGAGKQDGGHENSVGVLDIKWISSEPHPQLITACADGYVKHMKLTKLNDSTYSYTSASLPASTDDVSSQTPPICLSVDNAHNSFVTSTNDGSIVLGKIDNNEMGVTNQWKGHTHEAWTAVFGSNTDTVLSGGDDCKLCVWDVRCGPGVCVVSKKHEMGVVSISINPDNPTQFASGSYNEVLSLWDQRNMKRVIQELSAGGGVWRIKWNISCPNLVALACMHGGFKIADINKNEIICSYDGHKSLAYGIDWYQHGAVGTGTRPQHWNELLASCSFYDHSLQLWTLTIDLNN